MALDAVLGTGKAHLSASVTVTTTSAVAPGSLIVYFAAGFVGGATISPPGAGLTWTGVPSNPVTSGNLKIYCWYAQAPAGLAVSTALTASSSGTPDLMACAIALTGRDTSSPLTGSNGRSASVAAWDGGAVTTAASDDLIAVAFEDGSGTETNSVSGANVEWADFTDATQSEGMAGVYQLGVAGGSITAGGTWGTAASWVGIAASFKVASATAPTILDPAAFFEEHGPGDFGPNQFVDPAVITTGAPVAVVDATVVVGTGSADASGTAAATQASSTVVVGTGSATASGTAAATQASSTVAVGTGSATASGTAASPQASSTVVVGTGSATASGTAASPVVSVTVVVGTGSATADGTAVATKASSTVAVGTGSATASGTTATPVPVDAGDATVVVGTGVADASGTAATPVVTPDVQPPAPGPTGGRYQPGGDETSIYPETVNATVKVGAARAWASGTRAIPFVVDGLPRFTVTRRVADATVSVGAAAARAAGSAVAPRVAAHVGVGAAAVAGSAAAPVRLMRVEDAERMRDEAVAAVMLLSAD